MAEPLIEDTVLGTDPLFFLDSLGPAFGLSFVGLAGMSLHQFSVVRQLAALALDGLDSAQPSPPRTAHSLSARSSADHSRWKELGQLRGRMGAAVARAQLTLSAIPTLALLGTCLGFFYAIANAGALELSSQDPLAILKALMDGGISTALATTVLGQALYLVLGQLWSWWVAGVVEVADAALDEELNLLRARLSWVDLAPREGAA